MKRFCLVIFFLSLFRLSNAQNLFINEFMAANSTAIADPDYREYGDWIELYNAGTGAVNLKGYSITDLLSQPQKYIFTTDLFIQPKSYLIIWADDKNTKNHTNFKLSASGESIGLFDAAGNVVDTLTFSTQQSDISQGRFPDGSAQWYKFFPSTPGASNKETSITEKLALPILSSPSGFYSGAITIAVSHPASGVTLRYTLDGHTPTEQSLLYNSPIKIDSTTVLRIKAFKSGSLPSAVVTASYFINEQSELPIFSLVTDPENFFSDTSGIYVEGTKGIIANCSAAPRNWNQDWERPVELEFFEKNRTNGFKVSAGVKIFGGCARLYPQKSLAFYFRSEYGIGKLPYRLFPDQKITEYNNFVLRSSGQDWWRTMFRDGMAQTLIKQGMNLDYQDYRPSILFINGKYWGIHNIREKLNEHYVEAHYNINPDSIDLIEISKGISASNGDMNEYNALVNFYTNYNLAVQSNYEYFKTIMDIDEYIDYIIAEIYAANGDWPGANSKLWKQKTPNAKWRWMIYDLDFTFGGNAQGQYNTNTLAQATAVNGPSWPNPPWATLMLRKLLENTEFKNEFIQRYAVHLNTTFEKNHVVSIIDSLAQGIVSEIPRHIIRWPQSISLDKKNFTGNVQIMKDFAAYRPDTSRTHFIKKFSLSGTYSILISRNDPSMGKVFTHNIEVQKNGALHTFFKDIPVKVKAVPLPGFRFVQWQGATGSTNPEITLVLSMNSTLKAVFEPAELSVTMPLINEINYKSSPLFDTEDWIEIYNPSSDSVNMSGWKFRGEGTSEFIFPSEFYVKGRSYIVLCRDTAKFKMLRPEVKNITGNLGFGLSSGGEKIQLLNANGIVIDEVAYLPTAPWAVTPNGNGPTLALINPQSDNSLPQSWRASKMFGTPGQLNDVYTKVEEQENGLPAAYFLSNNYPNPFNPVTVISYQLPANNFALLKVYDVVGREVATLVNEQQQPGNYSVQFNASKFSSGLYFYTLRAGNFVQTKKMFFIK